MAPPGQKRRAVAILWQAFFVLLFFCSFCARCYDKGKGSDPCISKQECAFCNVFISEQLSQLATSSYKSKI